MIQTILLILVALIAVVLILAAKKPNTFHVERSINMKTAPEKIFPLINDFRNWKDWSPYEKFDPAMKKTYSGSTNGKGAIYEWSGNSKAGTGRMEIIETGAPSKIVIKLDFLKPFEGHNIGDFTLKTEGDSTKVTWAMNGPNPMMSKIMGIFINMDNLIGKDFASGLANLKMIVEK